MRQAALALAIAFLAACSPASSQPSATAAATASDSATPRPQAAVPVPLVSESPGAPTPTPSPLATIRLKLDANWTAVDRSADGFAIGLPPRWRDIDLDPQTLDASLRSIDDPQYQALLREQTSSLLTSGVKVFAFDFTPSNVSSTGFTTNLNVILEALPYTVSLDVYEQLALAQLSQLDAVSKPVAHQRVTLPAGTFTKLTYRITLTTASGQSTSSITQYAIVSGLSAYVLTFTTTPAQATTYASTFTKIASTFTLAK
ncbi:MAG TPA: hypothetical protein VFA01_02650 [Candidatus Dormibacteraeota bacterium]|nr:hypothetical protein [Candidatus Dormibacteraeota bacterium]